MYVQLYHDNTVALEIAGQPLELAQNTKYPWDGTIAFQVNAEQPVTFELALRIPDWCGEFVLSLNGVRQAVSVEKGYALVSREWSDGDKIELILAMPVERVLPHREIRQVAGQVALQRGPLIYCLEEADNGPRLANVCIPSTAELEAIFDGELFGGVAVIEGEALRIEPSPENSALYRFHSREQVAESTFRFRAIRVWLRSC